MLTDGWLVPQTHGTCDNSTQARTPCFLADWNLGDEASCAIAGCCWSYEPPPAALLNLCFSAERTDHFTDSTCAGCGDEFAFVRAQGYALSGPEDGLIALILYWNVDPLTGGVSGDNVVSTAPPSESGYILLCQGAGLHLRPKLAQPPGTNTVKLWYSAALLDHFTTAGPLDEAEAEAGNYTLLSTLGYLTVPHATQPNTTALSSCYQRAGNIDWYIFEVNTYLGMAQTTWVRWMTLQQYRVRHHPSLTFSGHLLVSLGQ